MKWFYICYEDLSRQSAPAIHVREVVRALHKLGQKVVLFVPAFSGTGVAGIETVCVPAPRVRFIGAYLYGVPLLFVLLKEYFRRRPDIFYTRDMNALAGAALAARLVGCPHVVESNGCIVEDLTSMGAPYTKVKILRLITRVNLALADFVIAVAQGLAERLQYRYFVPPEKIFVVENGVDTHRFRSMGRESALERIGLPEQYRYIVYAGSFYPHHGLDYLVASLPYLRERFPEARVLLIGNGLTKDNIVSQVRSLGLDDLVIFRDAVPHEDMPFFVNAADLCVLFWVAGPPGKGGACTMPPKFTHRYATPMKMNEYFACGKPVLANALDDIGTYIEQVGAGIAVDVRKPKEIADAIDTVLSDESARERMGEAGRSAVRSWEETTSEIIDVCGGLIR